PMLLHLGGAAGEAAARQHLGGNFKKVLGEEFLAAVDIEDALLEHEIGRGRIDGGLRDALRERVLLELREPWLELAGIAAVGLRPCRARRADERRRQQSSSYRPHRCLRLMPCRKTRRPTSRPGPPDRQL